jgi:hypothetical protein
LRANSALKSRFLTIQTYIPLTIIIRLLFDHFRVVEVTVSNSAVPQNSLRRLRLNLRLVHHPVGKGMTATPPTLGVKLPYLADQHDSNEFFEFRSAFRPISIFQCRQRNAKNAKRHNVASTNASSAFSHSKANPSIRDSDAQTFRKKAGVSERPGIIHSLRDGILWLFLSEYRRVCQCADPWI